jgi:hypothetical protein
MTPRISCIPPRAKTIQFAAAGLATAKVSDAEIASDRQLNVTSVVEPDQCTSILRVSAAARPLWLLWLVAAAGCASLPSAPGAAPSVRVAVAVPRDAVPIRSLDALTAASGGDPVGERGAALEALRGDLSAALRARGVEVVDLPATPLVAKPDFAALAAEARAAGADFALDTELVAYGDIRRSWLWVLGAQALLAGVGHGLVVGEATHDSTLAWQAGGAEFLLETVTWVGGALVGGRLIDPVLVRIRLIDDRDGRIVKRWTGEGLRPWRQWLRRRGLPPRDQRLRSVADRVFTRLAAKVTRVIARRNPPARRAIPKS